MSVHLARDADPGAGAEATGPTGPAGPTGGSRPRSAPARATAAAVLRASWQVVDHAGLRVPLAATVVLVAVTWPLLDDGYALPVLRGAGVLLAAAVLAAVDDPAGEVLGASPFPRAVRSGARLLAALGAAVPLWVLTAVLVEVRVPAVPVLGAGLEALALAGVGTAVGAGLRCWREHHAPSPLAVVALVLALVGAAGLPRSYAMLQSQTWGPPWEAAQLRWAAVLLLAGAVVALAWRDPCSRRRA